MEIKMREFDSPMMRLFNKYKNAQPFEKKGILEAINKKKEDFAIDGISGMRAIESRFDMDGNLKYYYDHIWHKFNKYEYIQYKKEGIHTHSDKYDCF